MIRGLHSAANGRAGFSLIEAAISCALLGTFVGSLGLVLFTASRTAGTSMVRQSLERSARRTLDRVATELVSAGTSAFIPDPTAPFGSASLTFQRVDGVDEDSDVVWSTPLQLGLHIEEDETDDGLDNNGNGLVDECKLVWTLDPGGPRERSTVWAHRVREYLEGEEANGLDDNGNGVIDERGLSFVREGGRVTIRLSLQERDGVGDVLVRTVQTAVRPRN